MDPWFSSVKTKWGTFGLEGTNQGVSRVMFPHRKMARLGAEARGPGKNFAKYFKNPHVLSKHKLDLSRCTVFEKKVYRALCRVPAGAVISYSALAKKAGFRKASRAVGTAMKKNRLPILIPCHRVIREDGSLGNYSCGVKWKKLLLRHEGYL